MVKTRFVENFEAEAKAKIIKKDFSYVDEFYEQESVSTRATLSFLLADRRESTVNKNRRRVWDISKWISTFNTFENNGMERLERTDALKIFSMKEIDFATFLGSYPLDLKLMGNQAYDFYKAIMFLLFSGKVKRMLKTYKDGGMFRDASEMFQLGKMCHQEQVFYRIDKKLKLNTGGDPVQSFYMVNTSKQELLEWLDTQVKYGEEYLYEVYTYSLVLATEYKYTNLEFLHNKAKSDIYGRFLPTDPNYDTGTPIAKIDMEYYPYFLLVEQPYFSFSGVILDSPPVPPEVEFVSFIGQNDHIMINIHSNTGDFLEEGIYFNEEERKYHDQIRNTDGKIRFKNDDGIAAFEIRRTELYPESWVDFGENVRIQTSSHGAYAVSFFEQMEMNKKYYYIFRSVDKHGHKSNPSPIYEVELIGEQRGFFFLSVKTVPLKKADNKQLTKMVRKYIQINPDVLQSIIDYENSTGFHVNGKKTMSANDIYPKLGVQTQSVFGRDYKLRITSKKTGKKIDVNFRYVHKHEREI